MKGAQVAEVSNIAQILKYIKGIQMHKLTIFSINCFQKDAANLLLV